MDINAPRLSTDGSYQREGGEQKKRMDYSPQLGKDSQGSRSEPTDYSFWVPR
jgi:hypothetical protein